MVKKKEADTVYASFMKVYDAAKANKNGEWTNWCEGYDSEFIAFMINGRVSADHIQSIQQLVKAERDAWVAPNARRCAYKYRLLPPKHILTLMQARYWIAEQGKMRLQMRRASMQNTEVSNLKTRLKFFIQAKGTVELDHD